MTKMRIVHFFISLTITSFIYSAATAQISDSLYKALPDSLRPVHKLAVTDKERMLIILQTSPAFIYRFHDEIKAMGKQLEKVIERIKTNEEKMLYAQAIAGCYEQMGDFSHGDYWYRRVIAYGEGEKANRLVLANAYLNVALEYATHKKQDSAVALLHKATAIAVAEKDSATLRDTYYTYMPIYKGLKLYLKAIDYANKYLNATSVADKWSPPYIEVMLSKTEAFIHLYDENRNQAYYDSATLLVRKVMNATQKDKAYYYKECYYLLGQLHHFEEDYKGAVYYYDSSLAPEYNQPGSYAAEETNKIKLFRGIALVRTGKGENIPELLAIHLSKKDFESRRYLNKVLYQYYDKQGDYKNALDFYKQYKAYADSIDIVTQKGIVFEAEQKYSVAQKEADITVLQNRQLQAQVTRNRIVVTGILLVLVLALVAMLLYLRVKKQQHQKALALASQRRAISANMHDEVSSGLVALRYLITDLKTRTENAETKAVLEDIEEEANHVYIQSRNFMHQINNQDVEENYNVTGLLQKLMLQHNGESNLHVSIDADEDAIEKYFTPQQHAEMYRVIKEAVANSMKHSAATTLHIVLSMHDNSFCFEIADNGAGMVDEAKDGMGMTTIKHRLAALKGKVSLKSNSSGTVISGSFPLAVGSSPRFPFTRDLRNDILNWE